jgi:predicted secreted protein
MKPIFALIPLMLLSSLALADDAVQLGIINLDASASRAVENDELVTRLEVIENGRNPAKLTDLVNQKTALVLDAVKNFKAIEAETSSYNTRPVYDDGKITSWQVSQQLTLETGNFDQMSRLIADISSMANIQSMHFQVSDSKAETIKQTLLKEAIAKFRAKAKLVAGEFDRSGYELVNLSIDGNDFTPRPMMERATMMASDSMSKSAPAALAGGKNDITLTVRGSVQLNLQ